MTIILQDRIPFDWDTDPGLPGIKPLGIGDWLHVDEAYGAQMARRTQLLSGHRDRVLAMDESARPAADELLEVVLALIADWCGFDVARDSVRCPDGRQVALRRDDPLGTLGLLVQEDLCLMQKHGDQHVLTGAVLCFPASWMLSEKFMKPLNAIHAPVDVYDQNIERRVQRLFDGVRVGRPLWRFNALTYSDPELHQPRSEHAPRRDAPDPGAPAFVRSERQTILRLPATDAVLFAIHTYVVKQERGPLSR